MDRKGSFLSTVQDRKWDMYFKISKWLLANKDAAALVFGKEERILAALLTSQIFFIF